ncbi:MAG: type transport system ATP-binding protein, partial [Actinomycetota bacterium]|nr:type transport system ATP-binding protein [Actinomycetota bacterium]
LGAVVPKYGWTDLVESLVPSGHYLDQDPQHIGATVLAPTNVDQALSAHPVGVEKQSVVTGLYGTGNNMAGNHTTFPSYMNSTYNRLQQGEPYDSDPAVMDTLKGFLEDRSAYYQQSFWTRVANGLRVPIFAAGTITDPLFPTMETVRFYNKLTSVASNYPIKMYFGDYQHLYAQNKPKEWDSLCGDDHHVCSLDDYKHADGSVHFGKGKGQVRAGALARIDTFLNYYLKGKGKKPANDVSATTTICSSNATDKYPQNEPGIEYRAKTWRSLATKVIPFGWLDGTITNAAPDANAAMADPVSRSEQSEKCTITSASQPEAGVITATSDPTKKAFTFMGIPWLQLDYTTTDTDYWVAARVYDQTPDGTKTMVTRGICRVNTAAAPKTSCKTFDLWGGAWTFPKGDQVVVELTQSDTPTFRKDNNPSMMTVKSIGLGMPATSNAQKVDFRG